MYSFLIGEYNKVQQRLLQEKMKPPNGVYWCSRRIINYPYEGPPFPRNLHHIINMNNRRIEMEV